MNIKFPIDESVDYRLPENRLYLTKAWAEAMYHTGELDQQLRLMNMATDNMESKLWLAFLWGCCYNLIGPWVILDEFPTPPKGEVGMELFSDWYNENFQRFRVDTDCRYRKANMIACIQSYVDWLGDETAESKITKILNEDNAYEKLQEISNSWAFFGRLSCWNYLEAVALVTEDKMFDCPDFLLSDVSGSESNRNGLCFVIGREELVTKHGIKKKSNEKITSEELSFLCFEGERVFQELKKEFQWTNCKRFNVETIFCWLKKRFRNYSSRYLGWDDERTVDEINYILENWSEVDITKILLARDHFLPEFMSSKMNSVDKKKMSVFYDTGTPVDLVMFQQGKHWELTKPKIIVKTNSLW